MNFGKNYESPDIFQPFNTKCSGCGQGIANKKKHESKLGQQAHQKRSEKNKSKKGSPPC